MLISFSLSRFVSSLFTDVWNVRFRRVCKSALSRLSVCPHGTIRLPLDGVS